MKLGDDTIGLRKVQQSTDEDEFGEKVTVQVDVEVLWCLVSPTERSSATSEPDNRTAPAITGYTVLAPPDAGIELADAIIWPITGRETVGGQLRLSGREWRVVGEPGLWGECTEVQMRAST